LHALKYKQAIKNISDRPKWKSIVWGAWESGEDEGLENRWNYTYDHQFKRKL